MQTQAACKLAPMSAGKFGSLTVQSPLGDDVGSRLGGQPLLMFLTAGVWRGACVRAWLRAQAGGWRARMRGHAQGGRAQMRARAGEQAARSRAGGACASRAEGKHWICVYRP